jgi:uncharacterized membrane protein YbaN (DUF454 family)
MNWMVLLRRIGGTAAFMLGIVSLVLPVLPGWLFIGIGLYILSKDSPGMQGRINVLRSRYRHVHTMMTEVERRFGHHPPEEKNSERAIDATTTPERKV